MTRWVKKKSLNSSLSIAIFLACSTFYSSPFLRPTPYSPLFASKPKACAPLRLLNFEQNNQLFKQSCAGNAVECNSVGVRPLWRRMSINADFLRERLVLYADCSSNFKICLFFLLSCIVWARHLLWFYVEAPGKDGLKSETEHRKKKRRKEKPDNGGDGTSNQGAAPKKLKLTINFKGAK